MNSEERQLITGLFDRMRSFGTPEKDREAEALIRQAVHQMPDAPYMLVQSVLVQEHALQQADQRIRELEDQVSALQAQTRAPSGQPGGFLGGLFGGSRPSTGAFGQAARNGGSVPSVSGGRGPMGAPTPTAAAGRAAAGGPTGGGFLQSAMATAAGVAGGMLLANSISSMLGGPKPTDTASASTGETGTQPAAQQTVADDAHADAQDDARYQDADYDSAGGDWGGVDDYDI